LSIKDLLCKWGCDSIEVALQDEKCFAIMEVVELLPTTASIQTGDDELGLIDLPWMGLIPGFLQDIVDQTLGNLDGNCLNSATRSTMLAQLKTSWKDIKIITLVSYTAIITIVL